MAYANRMSADNGVYILEMIDECRVTEGQAIDNVYYWFDQRVASRPNPYQVIRYFESAPSFKDKAAAQKHARNVEAQLSVCEYGISTIPVNCTWKELVRQAVQILPNEIVHLKKAEISEDYKKTTVKELEEFLKLHRSVLALPPMEF
jgi:hypothetical protein